MNLTCDILVSRFAFKCNLYRRYAKAAAGAARERDKTTKQAARDEDQLLSGKHKMKQITCVIDTRLAAAGLGRTLGDAFDMGVPEGGKAVPLLYKYEELPLEQSITWRYHPPSDQPVGPPSTTGRGGGGGGGADGGDGQQREVQSTMYTMVHLKGERFAEMCVVDHAASRRLGGGGGQINTHTHHTY